MDTKVTFLILLMMSCLYVYLIAMLKVKLILIQNNSSCFNFFLTNTSYIYTQPTDISVQNIVDEYYFGNRTKMSWFQAKEFCEFIGMGLLTPDTKEKNDKIFQEIKKQGIDLQNWHLLIGLLNYVTSLFRNEGILLDIWQRNKAEWKICMEFNKETIQFHALGCWGAKQPEEY